MCFFYLQVLDFLLLWCKITIKWYEVVESGKFYEKVVEEMFIGEFQHTLDPKGRLIIPAKFREDLGYEFVITKGLDGCLFVYPKSEWAVMENKMKALPLTNKKARTFKRFFFSGASECTLDRQGRVLIPGNLREYAGLTKDVVLAGVTTHLEIWDRNMWDEVNDMDNIDFDEVAEAMSELGI